MLQQAMHPFQLSLLPTDEYAGDDSFTVRYEDNDGNEYFIQYDLVIHAYNDEVASIISPSSTNVAMTKVNRWTSS